MLCVLIIVQESESSQSTVPSDLYDYLEKMDRDEEEAEETVCDYRGNHSPFPVPLYNAWSCRTLY